jgi:hypothetical protein
MYAPAARRGTVLLVLILLVIAVLLEQAIAVLCPWLSQMGGVRPMIVFLDIPLETPVTIDWIPVGFIFILFYALVRWPGATGKQKEELRRRGWAILGRWWLLLIFVLTGGLLYYGISGFLPKAVRNGIDSFGMRADLVLPYPSGEIVHLNGGMVMLAFALIGWRLLINKAVPPATAESAEIVAQPAIIAAAPAAASPAARKPAAVERSVRKSIERTEGEGRIVMQIPDPVPVRTADGRPCIYVSMPQGLQQKRSIYPCVVEDGIRPAGSRKKEPQNS